MGLKTGENICKSRTVRPDGKLSGKSCRRRPCSDSRNIPEIAGVQKTPAICTATRHGDPGVMRYKNLKVFGNDEVEFDYGATEIGSLAERLNGVFRIKGASATVGLDFKRHVGSR